MGVGGQHFTPSKSFCANLRRIGWPQGRSGRVLEKKKFITHTGVQTLDGYVLIIYLSMTKP
jgi:hypothetical protein